MEPDWIHNCDPIEMKEIQLTHPEDYTSWQNQNKPDEAKEPLDSDVNHGR